MFTFSLPWADFGQVKFSGPILVSWSVVRITMGRCQSLFLTWFLFFPSFF